MRGYPLSPMLLQTIVILQTEYLINGLAISSYKQQKDLGIHIILLFSFGDIQWVRYYMMGADAAG